MSVAQIIVGGIVENIIVVDPATTVSSDGKTLSWPGGSLSASAGQTFMMQAGAGIGWTLSGSTLVAPAPVYVFANLAAALARSASSACAALIAQIMPDAAHQTAFQNAASILNGNAGVAPGVDPIKTKFANLAASYGVSASAFATLVMAAQGASLDLGTALATLNSAVAAATTAPQLATALSAFEAAFAAVVAEINASGVPTPVVASMIVIAGINA